MLMAVNCFEIEAALRTDAGVRRTPSSRFAIPYACSWSGVPFRLTPRLQPGESLLFHSENSWSTLVEGVPVYDVAQAMTEALASAVATTAERTMTGLFTLSSRELADPLQPRNLV